MDVSNFDKASEPANRPSVYEQDDRWWWIDESGDTHGPCSSKESATRRQNLYVRIELEPLMLGGPLPFGLVTREQWSSRMDNKPASEIHPCNRYEPWDCECAGACSCHFV